MKLIAELVIGAAIGLAIAAAIIHGVIEFADWIVEYTHERN